MCSIWRMIDVKDQEILNIIQSNARITNADVARAVGMAPSAVLERIRKLEERGVIQAYEARIDARAVGVGLLAFVAVRVEEHVGSEDAGRRLAELPEVLEVHHVAGEDCYLLKVRAPDTETLGLVLRDRIGPIEGVRSTRTTVVLRTLKESGVLPLPGDEGGCGGE